MSEGKLFKVYRSSAGSGKTFTLVREYLRLCISSKDPNYFSRILAITFTNKAAEEMKERVLNNLRGIAEGESSIYFNAGMQKQLIDLLKIDAQQLQSRCAEILRHMLHHYGDLAISTIDKFIHGLIRSFSRDLRLSPDFEVDIDSQGLISRAVEELLSRVGIDHEISKLLIHFTESQVEDEADWKIREALQGLSIELLKESAIEPLEKLSKIPDEVFLELPAKLKSAILQIEKDLSDEAASLLAFFEEHNLEDRHFKGKLLPKWLQKFVNGHPEWPKKTINESVETGLWCAKSLKGPDREQIDRYSSEISSRMNMLMDKLSNQYSIYKIKKAILAFFYPMITLRHISGIIDELKKSEGILPISEFNRMVAGIVASSPAPFIFERIGERYNHFLIDEFQDTSVLQWQNFIPLFENGLSKGYFSMIVGDGKQAIYRWRNGEVEQFIKLPKIFKSESNPELLSKQAILERNYGDDFLDTNYRSGSAIIDFNNNVFEFLKHGIEEETLSAIYNRQSQQHKRSFEGLVYLNVISSDSDEIEEKRWSLILDHINACIEKGYERRDIAILCRRKADCKAVAAHLLANDLPVITADSLSIVGDPQVLMILALLKLKEDFRDLAAALDLIVSWHQIHAMPESTFESIQKFRKFRRDRKEEPLKAWLDTSAFLVEKGLGSILEVRQQEGLFSTVERMIRNCGFSVSANAYLEFFMEHVYQFSLRNNDTSAFLQWWSEKGDSAEVRVSQSLDAIQIMTIHKSKGLQFPVVILPFLDQHPGNHVEIMWTELENEAEPLEVAALKYSSAGFENTRLQEFMKAETARKKLDELNSFYVACTRPEDRLYLITSGKHNPGKILLEALSNQGHSSKAEEWSLSFGSDLPKTPKEEEKSKNIMAEKVGEVRDFSSLSLSYEAPDYWDVDRPIGKRDKGTIYHEVLAGMRNVEDLKSSLSIVSQVYELSEREELDYFNYIAYFVNIQDVKPWFDDSNQVLIEKAYLTATGQILRPDRIIIEENRILLIDFKTGAHHPKYNHQLKLYAQVLQEVYNKPVIAFLGFIVAEQNLVHVPV